VIPDQLFLRIADGFLHGMQLLGEIKARAIRFEHRDYGSEVAFRALQSSRDCGKFVHVYILSP
jgi:hypothetical protein